MVVSSSSLCPGCLNSRVSYREYEGSREIEGPCRVCGSQFRHVFAVYDPSAEWVEVASISYEEGFTLSERAHADARELLFRGQDEPFTPIIKSMGLMPKADSEGDPHDDIIEEVRAMERENQAAKAAPSMSKDAIVRSMREECAQHGHQRQTPMDPCVRCEAVAMIEHLSTRLSERAAKVYNTRDFLISVDTRGVPGAVIRDRTLEFLGESDA